MSTPGVPVLGPCETWVTAAEVAACCAAADVGSDSSVLDASAVAASQVLFELSGGQFSGSCEVVAARPCADDCGCWGWLLEPMSPGAPQVAWGSFGWGSWPGGWGWGWDGCGSNRCGCGALSRATLSGYPVTEITEVKIDGVVVDPTGYRLDGWKYLTRLADPDTLEERFWPACQRLDLDDTELGTWSVSYRSGVDPPPLGIQAAAQLACQIFLACSGSASCDLPAGVTKIDRQGITIERAPFLAWGLKQGAWATGLSLVDLFLSSYNPAGLRRRTAVWNPDSELYAERVGP